MTETKLALASLVPYRDYQIASRSLARRLGITLPLAVYAMAAGETISTETASRTRLLQCLDGVLTVDFTDHSTTVESGTLLVIPAGTPHALRAAQPCKFMQIESEERDDLH
ncbi:cupin domain-containing protein [Lacticaseibacillus jixianensis]|uniref:Cupin domain-containing protein n=1 Tax=Lacticaseibacillus jixianensis TaxID=2486012 RepID=A0ABW4B8U2_9LACO|nr:cupin domain-containing protein [Lacticaseibacillus jixianensis]